MNYSDEKIEIRDFVSTDVLNFVNDKNRSKSYGTEGIGVGDILDLTDITVKLVKTEIDGVEREYLTINSVSVSSIAGNKNFSKHFEENSTGFIEHDGILPTNNENILTFEDRSEKAVLKRIFSLKGKKLKCVASCRWRATILGKEQELKALLWEVL